MQKYPLPSRATQKQSAEPKFQENNVRIETQGANLPKGVAAPCGVVCESSLRKEVIQMNIIRPLIIAYLCLKIAKTMLELISFFVG